ncbi:FAD dependent oxidoreductase [Dacryopinax primogenitus]|uniref:FAD dependent oxidoreductase n=1 Tax=Dacryopinax primogenitus (strain DJM 731) TaxID=1858805 RepID=M5FQ59_DACPD|nr:FAD dependent oxidoreductase [Dacryopinax primogenitus]EJT96749.1 FAD dependent oxidoreductase [Dacryopinax primogenitus]
MLSKEVIIIGSGAFGLSTAYHLLKTGRYRVTVLERAPAGLAVDAASTDINKIVRSDYSDMFYARLAKEAIEEWRKPEWKGTYHECGVIVLGDDSATGSYSNASLENCETLGSRIERLKDLSAITGVFPSGISTGNIPATNVYINRDGGWAAASEAVAVVADKVRELGGSIISGAKVKTLHEDASGKVDGVILVSGQAMLADLVIAAAGSWTPSLLPGYGAAERMVATGQSVATIQLTAEEAELYRNVPVVLDFASGWYGFPPNKDNIMKCAIHHAGYTNPQESALPGAAPVSTPRTVVDGGIEGKAITRTMIKELRQQVKAMYPDLGKKPLNSTRMCWYTDTPDSDWIFDFHPDHSKLLFATGGSGHAFKFLPTLGRFALGRIEGTLDEETAERFAWAKAAGKLDMSRIHQETKILVVEELADPTGLSGC